MGCNAANRKTLATMARYSYEQGLAVRLVDVEEMFAEGNLSETKRLVDRERTQMSHSIDLCLA